MLVLCRGLFTPGYNKEASRVHDNVHGVALRQEQGGRPLEESFAEVRTRPVFEIRGQETQKEEILPESFLE